MRLRNPFAKPPGRGRETVRPKTACAKAPMELPVAPVLLLATGAGVAVWWWTQWARGRAESEGAGRTQSAEEIPPSQGGSA